MHGNGTRPPIPLKMNCEKELKLDEVTYLEFVLEARFKFVNFEGFKMVNEGIIKVTQCCTCNCAIFPNQLAIVQYSEL